MSCVAETQDAPLRKAAVRNNSQTAKPLLSHDISFSRLQGEEIP